MEERTNYLTNPPEENKSGFNDEENNRQDSLQDLTDAVDREILSGEPVVADDHTVSPDHISTAPVSPARRLSVDSEPNDSGKKKRIPVRWLIVCLILALLVGCGSGILTATIASDRITANLADDVESLFNDMGGAVLYRSVETASVSGSEMTATEAASVAVDSVVEIYVESVSDSFFGQQVSQGAGSGVIISENGYIVTNYHVIESATDITIALRNGETYDAELIGGDDNLDIAVLKIDANDLTTAVFGDSGKVLVGDEVVAIGNPLGSLGGTVTVGHVSALEREITIENKTMTLMQTDAAVNSGNSGGGLFDTNGNLIGIVVAYASGIGVSGLNFVIPINSVTDAIEDIINYGYVRDQVSLGIYMVEINDQRTAMQYRVGEYGVYVLDFTGENTNAERAGLASGDMIVSIDGEAITSAADVSKIISGHNVGDKIKIVVKRGDKEKEITVTLYEKIPDSLAS